MQVPTPHVVQTSSFLLVPSGPPSDVCATKSFPAYRSWHRELRHQFRTRFGSRSKARRTIASATAAEGTTVLQHYTTLEGAIISTVLSAGLALRVVCPVSALLSAATSSFAWPPGGISARQHAGN